jgi:ATP-dependent Clp protease ATP-binding subunit ClpA
LSEKTGVSVGSLSDSEKEKLANIEETIKKSLVGQEIAVSLIGKSLRSRLATVKSDNRPFGFLSRRTFLLQEIFQGLICSKSLKISLFILSSIVSLLVLLK